MPNNNTLPPLDLPPLDLEEPTKEVIKDKLPPLDLPPLDLPPIDKKKEEKAAGEYLQPIVKKKQKDIDTLLGMVTDQTDKLKKEVQGIEKQKDFKLMSKYLPMEAKTIKEISDQIEASDNPTEIGILAQQQAGIIAQMINKPEYREYANERVSSVDKTLDATKAIMDDTERLRDTYKSTKEAGYLEAGAKGVGAGLGGYFKDYLDFMTGFSKEKAIRNLNKKLDSESFKSITTNERRLIEALMTNAAAHSFVDEEIPESYRVGQIIGGSLGFMVEFAATGGIGKGVGTAIKGAKALGKGAAAHMGKNIFAKMAQAGIQTAGMPTFYKDVAKRTAKGESFGSAVWNAYYDTAKENLSERLFMSKFKGVGNQNAIRKFITKGGSAVANAKGFFGIVKGTSEEILEEKFSDIMGAAKDANSWEEYKKMILGTQKDNVRMLWSVGVMSAVLGGPSAISQTRSSMMKLNAGRRLPKGLKNIIDEMMKNKDLSPDEMNDLIVSTLDDYVKNGELSDKQADEAHAHASKYGALKLYDMHKEIQEEAKKKAEEKEEEHVEPAKEIEKEVNDMAAKEEEITAEEVEGVALKIKPTEYIEETKPVPVPKPKIAPVEVRQQELEQKKNTELENLAKDFKNTEVPMTKACLLYTSPSPRDVEESRMPSSA